MNLGAEHSGSTGKLYYYDSSGKMIYMDAGEIGEDGNISLSFSHASEYVVVFEKAPLDQDDETDSGNKGEGTLAPDRDEKKDTVCPVSKRLGRGHLIPAKQRARQPGLHGSLTYCDFELNDNFVTEKFTVVSYADGIINIS